MQGPRYYFWDEFLIYIFYTHILYFNNKNVSYINLKKFNGEKL